MKDQFHIVLITVGLFFAGLLAGVWTQRTRPIPAPPAPVLGEFGNLPPAGVSVGGFGPGIGGFGFGVERSSPEHAAAVATMNTKIAELEPKIRGFQEALDLIEKDFLNDVDRLLSPEQRQKLTSLRALAAPETSGSLLPPPPFPFEGHNFVPPPPPPLQITGGQRYVLTVAGAPFPVGGWLLMSMIIYQPSLDNLTSELKLDPAQRVRIKELMVERRTRLLALIDKSPPPTLGFGEALP